MRGGQIGRIKMVAVLMAGDVFGFYRGDWWRRIAADHHDPQVSLHSYLTSGERSCSDPKISGGGEIYR